MYIWKECILWLWDGMFCIYLLSLSGLKYHLRPVFHCWFYDWMIYVHWCRLVLKSPVLLNCQFLPLCQYLLYVFRCPYIGCICIYNCYIFLDLCLYQYVLSLVFCDSLCFQVCFIWYKYLYLIFGFVFHFYLHRSEMNLVGEFYIYTYISCFCIYCFGDLLIYLFLSF